MDSPTPAALIREARWRLRIDQHELAPLLGVSPRQLRRWENGEREAGPHVRYALAGVLLSRHQQRDAFELLFHQETIPGL